MQINKNKLEKSQVEINTTLNVEEFKPFIEKAIKKLSEQVKVEGFRPGKVPYEILKQKIGEMAILEEAANLAIRGTIDEVLDKQLDGDYPAKQPQVEIIKLAPDNDFSYKVKLLVLPRVKLGEYKDLNIKKEEVKIDDKEIDKAIEYLRDSKAKEIIKEGPAVKGDKLIVDINMSLNKVPLEDGQGKDVAVILGKEYFLPGFDEKLTNVKKGEIKEFSLVYPKDHHQKNMAGKNVDFKVTVKEVFQREVPDINDGLAQSLQFKDLEDLKKAVSENLLKEKERNQEIKTEKDLFEKLITKSEFDEIPDEIVKDEAEAMLKETEQGVSAQGGKFEDYLQHLKKTKDQFLLDLIPEAMKRLKIALLFREIAMKEKIEVKDEEINQRLEEIKKMYSGQAKIEEKINSLEYKKQLEHSLLSDKIIKQLKEWNYANSGKK
jgi:trigger factor